MKIRDFSFIYICKLIQMKGGINKMKKILNLFAIMFVAFALVFSMPVVLAQTSPQEGICAGVEAGVMPSSPFYFADGVLEDLNLALTSDTDKKVAKELENACEKLAELEKEANEGDMDNAQDATEEYQEIMAELKEEIQEIQAETSEEVLKKQLELEQNIENLDDEIDEIENSLKIKIEVEGQITPEQQALIDSILANLVGQTGEVEIEIENEKGKTKIKIEIETGQDGDDVEDELKDELGIDEQEDAAEEIADAKEEIAKAKLKIAEAKADGEETSAAEQFLSDAEKMLVDAEAAFNAGNFEEAEELAGEAEDLAKIARMKALGKTLDEFENSDDSGSDSDSDNSGSDSDDSDSSGSGSDSDDSDNSGSGSGDDVIVLN